jgi:hypothetical protein
VSETTVAVRDQLERQLAHWHAATITLDDPENFAALAAWANVENYLGVAVSRPLQQAVQRLKSELASLRTQLSAARSGSELEAARQRLVAFRRRFTQTETVLDFYGDAINTRTSPKLGGLLRACDILAERSMHETLATLGREAPPVLSYVDKGLGASVLRAGVRLWDGGSISPAAAIKVTRHNLYNPTSLIHESGHQVAHLIGWNEELRPLFEQELGQHSTSLARMWAGWVSEITADVHAFAHCGYGAVAALHDVIAGDEQSIFRILPGDPHPVAYLRVLLNVQLCRSAYGRGAWDQMEEAWQTAYPLSNAPAGVADALTASVALLPRIAELCLERPLRAFGGRPLGELIDPMRMRPESLALFAEQAGPALYTSLHWITAEPLRLLALSSLRMATDPSQAAAQAEQYENWMLKLGAALRS